MLIDLRVLYPSSPHHSADYIAAGMRVQQIVEGTLSQWGSTTEGEKLAYVSYTIEFARDKSTVSHSLPVEVLRPAR